uniref:Uncharacterized protein n=1 Tax=Cannabis sativa TaxID=3483 RepID=A0A803QUI8_CANSA
MGESLFSRVIMETPPSIYIKGLSLVTLMAMALLGLLEMAGNHLGYSKFSDFSSQNRPKMSSRAGMLLLYTPAFLAGLASLILLVPHSNDLRFLFLTLALTIHFFKRVYEAQVGTSTTIAFFPNLGRKEILKNHHHHPTRFPREASLAW